MTSLDGVAAEDKANPFDHIDTLYQAALGRLTCGTSPAGLASAYFAWLAQLAQAPGKSAQIALYPFMHTARKDSETPDPRFKSNYWNFYPWRAYTDHFHLLEGWWKMATTNVSGLDPHDERIVSFVARQALDALCPANFPWTNPDIAAQTLQSGGANLLKGAKNAMADVRGLLTGAKAENGALRIGQELAATPGEVVFRNELIELIQYVPLTPDVQKEPVLILPAWIMKYYILDLSAHNSLVRWLVAQGHTVFMVSWKNPDRGDAQLGMDDYYRLGAMAALDVVSRTVPDTKIHLVGYCLGGTLALITAAAMARDQDDRLKSLSLFAAQGDFTDAGELMLFVTPSEVAFLKNMMAVQGYLDTKQMAGTFQLLHSYDLIWSKIVSDYYEGKPRDAFDLMVWNDDATRMPYKMHSEYLERLFLNNDFAEGRFTVEGRAVAPENIHVPIFAVGTEKDQVAPWQSVFKIHLMVGGEVTFALTSGGHNAGIVSEPGHPGRSYHLLERKTGQPFLSPEQWLAAAEFHQGSWWEPWQQWLANQSDSVKEKPAALQRGFGPAPGTYVLNN